MSMAPSDPSNPDPGKPQVPPPGVSEQQQAQMDSVMQTPGSTTPQLNMEAIEEYDRTFEKAEVPLGVVPESVVYKNDDGELVAKEFNWAERRWMSYVQGLNIITNSRDTTGSLMNSMFGNEGLVSSAEDPDQNPLGLAGANLSSLTWSPFTAAGKLAVNTLNAVGTFSNVLDMEAMAEADLGAVNANEVYGSRTGVAGFVEPVAQWIQGATVAVAALPSGMGPWATLAGAGILADVAAFDPDYDGGAVTGVREMLEAADLSSEEADAFMRELDPKLISQGEGGRKAGYAMLAAEGAMIGSVIDLLSLTAKGGRGMFRWFDANIVEPVDINRIQKKGFAEQMEENTAEVIRSGVDEELTRGDFSQILGPNQLKAREAGTSVGRAIIARRARLMGRIANQMTKRVKDRNTRAKELFDEGLTQGQMEAQLRAEKLDLNTATQEMMVPGFGQLFADSFGVSNVEGEVIARTMIFGKSADGATQIMPGMNPNKIHIFEGATPQGRNTFFQQDGIDQNAKELIGTVERGERPLGPGRLGEVNKEILEDLGMSTEDTKALKGLLSDQLKKYPMAKAKGNFVEVTLHPKKGQIVESIEREKETGKITSAKFNFRGVRTNYARGAALPNGKVPFLEVGTKEYNKRANKLARGLVKRMQNVEEAAKGVGPDADVALGILQAQSWYRGMAKRLGTEFGQYREMITEILGATSANTPVQDNFIQTQEIIQNFSRGEYDLILKYYDEHLKSGGTFKEWFEGYTKKKVFYPGLNNPIVTKKSGAKFNANTEHVMNVLVGKWRGKLGLAGGTPKTPNFAANLRWDMQEATIDVWADRALQQVFDGKRIPSKAAVGIDGKYISPAETGKFYGVKAKDVVANPDKYPAPAFAEGRGPRTDKEFGMGQEAFFRATEMLQKGSSTWEGLTPADLQALVWFDEKSVYTANNWTTQAGEGGSFEAWADMFNVKRYNLVAGGEGGGLDGADLVIRSVRDEISADDTVRAFSYSPSTTLLPGGVPANGYRVGSLEISTSNVVGNRNVRDYSPTGKMYESGEKAGQNKLQRQVSDPKQRAKRGVDEEGKIDKQDNVDIGVLNRATGDSVRRAAAQMGLGQNLDRVYIHEVVSPQTANFADNTNLRPGFELKFTEVMDESQIQPFLKRLQEEGLSAETMHVMDPNPGRANNTRIEGIRSIYVPEDAGVEHLVGNPIEALKHMEEQSDRINLLMREFLGYDGVTNGNRIYVDTEILRNGEYEQVLQEVRPGTPLRKGSGGDRPRQSWFDQPEATVGRREGGGQSPELPNQRGQTKLLAQTEPDSPKRTIRGFAEIDEANASSIIGGMRNPDVGTAIHEVGHAVRNHLFNSGVLTEGSRARLTAQFGTDGVWDVAAEERFADAFMGMAMNPAFNRQSDDMGIIAAKMRDIYKSNKGTDWIDGVSEDTKAVMENLITMPLPIEYAPGKWMPAINWSTLVTKIRTGQQRASSAGTDAPELSWMDYIEPGDWPGVARMGKEGSMNFRFDLDTDDQILQYLAYFNDLQRELYQQGALKRTTNAKRDFEAGKLMNKLAAGGSDLMGDRVTDLLRSKTLADDGQDEVHRAVNMALMGQLNYVKRLADRAESSSNTVDYAKLQRAFLQYQQVQVQATRLRRQAGQALQSYSSPVPLPTLKTLDKAVASEKFLEQLGMDTKSGKDLVSYIQALKSNNDTELMVNFIEEVNRSGFEASRRAFFEVYMNGLLSAPATFASISTVSPALVGTADGIGKIAGGLINWGGYRISGNRQLAERQMDMVAETMANTRRNLANMRAAFQNMGKVVLNERPQFINRSFRDDAFQDVRAIHRNMYGTDTWLAKGIQGFMTDAVGRFVRVPSTAIMTIDEGFRTMNGITAMQMKIFDDNWAKLVARKESELGRVLSGSERRSLKKQHSAQLHEIVSVETEKRIKDGQLQTRNSIAKKALEDNAIKMIEDPLERAKAMEDYVKQNWTVEHQQTNEMVMREAARPVFQEDMGPAARKFQGLVDEKVLGGFPRLIFPFIRTPINIQKKFFGMMPTSIATELYHRVLGNFDFPTETGRAFNGKGSIADSRQIRGLHNELMTMLNSGDPRQIAQARGQQAMGVAVLMGAYSLMANAENGGVHLTGGGGTKTQGDKERKAKAGWQAYSVFLPGKGYMSYLRLDPWGQIFAIAADTVELLQAEDGQGSMAEKEKLPIALIASIGKQLQKKSYLQGMANVMRAMTGDPDDGERFWTGLLQTALPTDQMVASSFQRHFSQADDGYMREARSYIDIKRANSVLADANNAPVRRDILGDKMKRFGYAQSESGLARFLQYTSPVTWTTETDDLLTLELAKHDMPMNKRSSTKGQILLEVIKNDTYKFTAYDRWYEILGEGMTMDNRVPADSPLDILEGGELELKTWTLKEALNDLVRSKKYAVLEGLIDKNGRPKQGVEMMNLVDKYTDEAYKQMVKEFPRLQVLEAHFDRENKLTKYGNLEQIYPDQVDTSTMDDARKAADDTYDRKINEAGKSTSESQAIIEEALNR